MTPNQRPFSITTLSVGALVAVLAMVGMTMAVFSAFVLYQSDRLHQRSEAALFESIQSEIKANYDRLEDLLSERHAEYRSLHEKALLILGDDPREADFELLQAKLADKAGIPVDLYLIDPDKRVVRTTYEPDEGLDFNQPALLDGKTMIQRAHRERDIVVSAPVLEAVSREFRIYTYSPIGREGYTFELGFVSPKLNDYFREMQQRLGERDLFDARLHFLMWDEWLLSLFPDRSEADASKKDDLLEEHRQRKLSKIERFREAAASGRPVRSANDEGEARYYLHIMDLPLPGADWDTQIMAEVTLDTEAFIDTRARLLVATAVMFLVLIVIALAGFWALRRVLALPLTRAANAAENWQPMALDEGGARVRELQLLRSHYNRLLENAQSRIEGLSQEAFTDALTGLPNRAKLEDELDIELRRSDRHGTPLCLIFLDLDHFKRINDDYGHLAGDDVLRQLGELLSERVRGSDTAGRWGGEEFMMICRDTTLSAATVLADALRERIERTLVHEGRRCTASVGVAAYRAGDDAESLLARADEAMYRAKSGGRNRTVTLG